VAARQISQRWPLAARKLAPQGRRGSGTTPAPCRCEPSTSPHGLSVRRSAKPNARRRTLASPGKEAASTIAAERTPRMLAAFMLQTHTTWRPSISASGMCFTSPETTWRTMGQAFIGTSIPMYGCQTGADAHFCMLDRTKHILLVSVMRRPVFASQEPNARCSTTSR
jgi:hypothetical protein